jgi:hypothetical protein
VVERMRDRFLGESGTDPVLSAEISLSQFEAWRGHVVPLEIPVRATCAKCGGRGETWAEPCGHCRGSGESVLRHAVRVSVPPRVEDGTKLRFRLSCPDASPIRVEVRVVIRPAAI